MLPLKRLNIVFVLLFLLVMTGCTNRPTGGIPNGSDIELSDEEDENISLKLKYYNSNCINFFSDQMELLQRDYVSVIDSEEGPKNEEMVPTLFALDPTEDCALAIAKAKELNLVPELDPLAEEYLLALQQAAPLIAQATRYYDQMEYELDDFEKGRSLHPELMAAFENFEKADANFRKRIQAIQTDLDSRLLEKYKAAGQSFEFLVQDAWIKGTELINKAEAEAYEFLDVTELATAMDVYQKALETLDAYLLEHPTEAALAQAFQQAAWEFMAEAKLLMSRKKENLPYDIFEGNAEQMRNEYEWWKDEYFL